MKKLFKFIWILILEFIPVFPLIFKAIKNAIDKRDDDIAIDLKNITHKD